MTRKLLGGGVDTDLIAHGTESHPIVPPHLSSQLSINIAAIKPRQEDIYDIQP